MLLLDFADDVLLAILEELPIASILSLRETCVRLRDLTRLRSVWLRIYSNRVLDKRLPFPNEPIDDLSVVELERRTHHALRLEAAWKENLPKPYRDHSFKAAPVNALVDVKIYVRDGLVRLLTISEGIWPVIECWDLTATRSGGAPERIGEWPCSGGKISNTVVNSDPMSRASIAFSVMRNGVSTVHVKSILKPLESDPGIIFDEVVTLNTKFTPVCMNGNLLVLSNERSEIKILDWRTGNIGILQGDEWDEEDSSSHRCLQVFFAHDCIFVARARTLDMFPTVELRPPGEEMVRVTPLASHSFGWIDGIAIASSSEPHNYPYSPITILLRAENGDFWASDIHTINRYDLLPNPEYQSQAPSDPLQSRLPYVFPPAKTIQIPSQRGFLRCPTIILGKAGIGLWVHPRIYLRLRPSHPLDQEIKSQQLLCYTIFRGPLTDKDPCAIDMHTQEKLNTIDGVGMVRSKTLWKSPDSITTLAYDEYYGLIVLGSHDGFVTVLYMA